MNKRYLMFGVFGAALALSACEAKSPPPTDTETIPADEAAAADDRGDRDPCPRTGSGTQCP